MNTASKHKAVVRRARLVPRGDGLEIIELGHKRAWVSDAYARLLGTSWARLAGIIALCYLSINVVFAIFYLILPGEIDNARPGSFTDAFFFSVQTMATIGYGKLIPNGILANTLVTLEAFLGFGYFAVVTGLLFAKFSKPTARVLFSDSAVICPHNGVPHLMIRLANRRSNGIVNVAAQMVLMSSEVDAENHTMRRFRDLTLVRSQIPILRLSWTLMHPLDASSPLYNLTEQKLRSGEAEIIISIMGLDETMSQTIHARHSYIADEIIFDARFEDILDRNEARLVVDYRKFHQIVPLKSVNAEAA